MLWSHKKNSLMPSTTSPCRCYRRTVDVYKRQVNNSSWFILWGLGIGQYWKLYLIKYPLRWKSPSHSLAYRIILLLLLTFIRFRSWQKKSHTVCHHHQFSLMLALHEFCVVPCLNPYEEYFGWSISKMKLQYDRQKCLILYYIV